MRNNLVLFILPNFSAGGAERVVLNLVGDLKSLGHSVNILVFNDEGSLSSMLPDNVKVHNLRTGSLRKSIFLLVKKIRQLNPKVIISTFGYINIALLAIRWLLPQKTEIWVREANLPSISLPNNPYPELMKFSYRLLYRKANKLICTSTKMRNEFVANFLVPIAIIEILPNPVNTKMIQSSMLPIKRFDKGGICCVAAGRLTFQKGFDSLLHWFSELGNKKSTLTILGDGKLKHELIQKTESLGLQERVQFVGFCNNPWQWYAGSDVFLLSSRWEGMSNAALEALVCGTPVIATEESGGIRDVMEQSENNSITIVTGGRQFIKAINKIETKDSSKNIKEDISKNSEVENNPLNITPKESKDT